MIYSHGIPHMNGERDHLWFHPIWIDRKDSELLISYLETYETTFSVFRSTVGKRFESQDVTHHIAEFLGTNFPVPQFLFKLLIFIEVGYLCDERDANLLKRVCNYFFGEITNWDVSKVTDMQEAFSYCFLFNKDISKWNVSNVTSMNRMFFNAQSFNHPLDRWNVSNVKTMNYMFSRAQSFNQPLDGWKVSNVETMEGMFYKAQSFNQPLDGWDVSRVKTMEDMFHYAQSFNQPLNAWNVSNVKTSQQSFQF
jgi:surface protein